MANAHKRRLCPTCGFYVAHPERRHDGCGGHAVCPFCGHDLPASYRSPNHRIVHMPSNRTVPTDA